MSNHCISQLEFLKCSWQWHFGVWLVILSTNESVSAQSNDRNNLILAAKVRAIFETKCVQCHGDDVAKPDADFGFIRDLRRVANHSAYVVKGSPQDSKLFRMMRDNEMPPDDSGIPPSSSEEKQILRSWILSDAPSQVPEDWKEIASKNKLPPQKSNAIPLPTYTSRLPDSISQTPVSIEMLDSPTAEILAKISADTKIAIDYQPTKIDPKISIRLKSGTLAEALAYVALNANLVLKWEDSKIRFEPTVSNKIVKPNESR